MNNKSYKLTYKVEGVLKTSSTLENEDYILNISLEDTHKRIVISPKKPLELVSFEEINEYSFFKEDKILLNGYQSWTDTKEFYITENIPTIRMPKAISNEYKFYSYGDYTWKQTKKGVLHGYTYSYIKGKEENLFIGSNNESNAFLIINYYVKDNLIGLQSDCEGRIISSSFTLLDYYYKKGNVFELQKEYFSKYKNKDTKKIKGYTSWYNHYQDINEEKVLYALEGINDTDYDLFQIDDGYETFVGDWLDIDKNKFPNGLKGIVEKIHDKNLLAGIWLAPFAVELNSKFYKEHNDLIYKENGKEVFGGGNWSKFVCLDISNPKALYYVEECLRFYIDLGFDLFKLDFLYAAGLVRGTGLTRAETLDKMFSFLRVVLKDKLILGCGAPLSSGFSKFDYCRIGPDVSLIFDDVFYMKFAHRERISTKVTLQNTIYRSLMDGLVFRNDPDVYLLREDNIKLNKEQKRALLTLNTLCGSVYMTSDNVKDYDEEKLNLLKSIEPLRNAEVTSFDRNKDLITINYSLDNKDYSIIYNTKKGVIVNG